MERLNTQFSQGIFDFSAFLQDYVEQKHNSKIFRSSTMCNISIVFIISLLSVDYRDHLLRCWLSAVNVST